MIVDPYGTFRRVVKGDPQDFQTYKIVQPRDTTIVASCQQVGCKHWREGWVSLIDETNQFGASQAYYIRHDSGRTFTESRNAAGMTVFRFECHQRCFTEHRTRPARFGVVGGDARGNPRGTPARIHSRPEDWVEDASEHLDRIRAVRARG